MATMVMKMQQCQKQGSSWKQKIYITRRIEGLLEVNIGYWL
jgi:hypothetical protein